MDSHPSPRGRQRASHRGDAYHRALDECARVAREEFSVAARAFDDAAQLARRLKTAVAARRVKPA